MRDEKIQLSPCFSRKEDFSSGMVPRFNSNGEIAPESLDLITNGSFWQEFKYRLSALIEDYKSLLFLCNGIFVRDSKDSSETKISV